MRKRPAPGAQVLYPKHPDMVPDGNSQNIIDSQDMAGFCDFGPVQANVSFFDESGGHGAVLYNTGKPKPLVQALRQFFLPII